MGWRNATRGKLIRSSGSDLRGEIESMLGCPFDAHDLLALPTLKAVARTISSEPAPDVSQEPAEDPLIGKTFAQYTVLGKLGRGGMGVVYRAKDTKLAREVALKFLPQQWSHDETAKQRFIREARAASATDHPRLITE